MPRAFSSFDEPHAWLIRGMVEYGWPDISGMGGHIPPGVPGGLNLARIPADCGQSGVVLEVPAVAGGQRLPEDGTYQFVVKVVQSDTGGTELVARCPEANFIQTFPYDPANPSWAAGYVHQAIVEYVPQFVQWRLGGGEVTWAQRSGMPDFDGEPCSAALADFVGKRLRGNQRFDMGPREGWWLGLGKAPPPPPQGGGGFQPGMIREGRGGGDPTYLSQDARAAVEAAGKGVEDFGSVQAMARVRGPGGALVVVCGLGMLQGFLWVLNAIITVATFGGDRLFATFFSMALGMGLLVVGAAASYGATRYRAAVATPLVYVSMVYAALTPFCCLGGLPIAIWAAVTWNHPMVRSARS